MDLAEADCEDAEWIFLALDNVQWWYFLNTVLNLIS